MRLLNIILSVFVLFSGNVIMYVPLHVIIITIIICDKILLQLNFLNMIKKYQYRYKLIAQLKRNN